MEPISLSVADLARELERRGVVALDLRDSEAFAEAHIPGSWSAALTGLAWRLRDSDDALFSVLFSGPPPKICLISETADQAWAAVALLAEVDLTVTAVLLDGVKAWRRSGRPVNRTFGPRREQAANERISGLSPERRE